MNKIKFAIPSYKRSEEQLTLSYLEEMGYSKDDIYISTQTLDDYNKYSEKYSKRANIIYSEGNCVSDNRNTLLNYFPEGQKIIMLDDDIKYIGTLKGKKIEVGVPTPRQRLDAMKEYTSLNKGGATLRLRPFIPGVSSEDYEELIREAHKCGATAVTTEFFCLEMRSINQAKEHYKTISECAGFDIVDFYRKHSTGTGYLRLNRKVKEKYIKDMQRICDELGMRFYVSDAHFKECSHNCCCCALNKNWDYSRGNFASALQIAKKCGKVYWKDIEKDMYFLDFDYNKAIGFNTNSSENRAKFRDMTMKDYLHYLWNNPKMGQSPYKIFEKALIPDGYDEDHNIIYKYNNDVTFEKEKGLKREEVLNTRV